MTERVISATPTTPLPEGAFLLPVCTDRLRFHMMLSALDRVAQDERDTDFLADYLNAQQYVADPTKSPCVAGLFNVTWEQSGCNIKFFVNGVEVATVDVCEISPPCNNTSMSAGADGEEDEEMPVQKVFIDCNTRELVVDYGGCNGECRFDLSCINGEGNTMPDDYTPPGETFFACGKAWGAVHGLWSLMLSMWDHCDEITPYPWAAIQAENPNWSINKFPTGFQALANLRDLKTLDYQIAEYTGNEQQVLCRVLPLFTATETDDLADDSKWEKFKGAFNSLDTDPVMDIQWQAFWRLMLSGNSIAVMGGPVIKREEVQAAAQSNAGDDTGDCSCPEAPDIKEPGGYGWMLHYKFKAALSADWVLTDLVRTLNGVFDDTPTGQYNAVNGNGQLDPVEADGTTMLKYAAIYWDAPAGWGRGVNPAPLYIASSPPVTLVPGTVWAENMAPVTGANAVWGDPVGINLAPGSEISFGIDGYNWYNDAPGGPLYITDIVIAGDGTPPVDIPVP